MAPQEGATTNGDGRLHLECHDRPLTFQRRAISEETPLLAAATDFPYNHHSTSSPDLTLRDDELEDQQIDPDDFNRMLSRSTSYTSGLGIEPESQETLMLRGPRRYSTRRGSRRVSSASARRRPIVGPSPLEEEAVVEEDEVIEEGEVDANESPYLGGVSIGRFWLIYTGILANLFVACFDMTILASSHPVITSYFNSSNSASWLSTAFLLTSTAFQPLFGRISDTMGRKPPFIFTLTIFLLATVWCAVARSMTEFILARALCGLGAGGTLVMGSIITSDLVPIEIRGTYQSYINIIYGIGSALGAATGGAIADSFGWRWEFGLQVPFLTVCLLLAIFTIPKNLGLKEGVMNESLGAAMKKFDYRGSLLLTTSITALILGLNLGGNIYDWSHPLVITSLAVFSIGFPIFIYWESTVTLPIMPLKIILKSPRSNIIFCNFLAAIIVNAILFNIPLYFQAVLLESATDSGLRLIVPSTSATIAGVSTGFLISWCKRLKWPLVSGASLLLVGTVCLSCMQLGMPSWLYLLFLVPSSMGQGFLFPGAFIALLSVSEQAEQAVVTSTMTLWRSLGMVLGVASSSLVVQNALVVYLNQKVTGPEKEKIVQDVRKSIQAIAKLPPTSRDQVIDAYAASLRLTFILSAVLALIGVIIIVGIRVPRLGKRV